MNQQEQRDDFEKWISDEPFARSIARYPNEPEIYGWPGNYQDITVQVAWESWKEAMQVIMDSLHELD